MYTGLRSPSVSPGGPASVVRFETGRQATGFGQEHARIRTDSCQHKTSN